MNKRIKLKARVVYEWEYEPNLNHYDCCESIGEIIEIDKTGVQEDPYLAIQDIIPEISIENISPHYVKICLECKGIIIVHDMSVILRYDDDDKYEGMFTLRDEPVYVYEEGIVKGKEYCKCKKPEVTNGNKD